MQTIELWLNSLSGIYLDNQTSTVSTSATVMAIINRIFPTEWSSVDWSKTNRELMRELGVGYQTVLLNRHRAGAVRAKTDWDSVDWSKTNGEIARQLGVKYGTVAVRRSITGATKAQYESKWADFDWDSLDWNENNNELARRTGMNPGTIRHFRIKLGYPRPTGPNRGVSIKVTDEMIEAANWKFKRDQDLATEWRVSRERVRQIRDHHNKPQCEFKHQSGVSLEVMNWIEQNTSLIEGKPLCDVLPLLPKATRMIHIRALKRAKVKIDWDFSHPNVSPFIRHVNWALPNVILFKIWTNFGTNGIATARGRFGVGKTKWNIQGWRGQNLPPDLIVAVHAEVVKAKAAGVFPYEKELQNWIARRTGDSTGYKTYEEAIQEARQKIKQEDQENNSGGSTGSTNEHVG